MWAVQDETVIIPYNHMEKREAEFECECKQYIIKFTLIF